MADLLAQEVAVQFEAIALDRSRPLIITDADEVLVRFGAGMEVFLAAQGLYYDWSAFHFEGTIRRSTDGQAIPNHAVAEIRERFLDECIQDLPVVAGAGDALQRLSLHTQIVILTNIPHSARDARRVGLSRHGIDYPIVTNVGGKGHAVRDLARRVDAPAIFVDDLPEHHESVALHAADVHRIHFIDDPRLEKLVGPAHHSHFQTETWVEVERVIHSILDIRAA
ncbi:MAG: hypothetical protein O2995_08570 [Proteobacteria bacterium]|nr:hypothetical protein [Pseudomonadota bacterium]